MKKLMITVAFVATCFVGSAQVGVGTKNPETTLDVVGKAGTTPGALDAVDGITVPVVTDDMNTTSTKGTKVSQMVYSKNAVSTGYYFWNGTAWKSINGPMKITETANSTYNVLPTDEIIKYTGTNVSNWTFSKGIPVGKMFYIIAFGSTITFPSETQGTPGVSKGGGAVVISLGNGKVAVLMGNY